VDELDVVAVLSGEAIAPRPTIKTTKMKQKITIPIAALPPVLCSFHQSLIPPIKPVGLLSFPKCIKFVPQYSQKFTSSLLIFPQFGHLLVIKNTPIIF
jgi:hypothetical protein